MFRADRAESAQTWIELYLLFDEVKIGFDYDRSFKDVNGALYAGDLSDST